MKNIQITPKEIKSIVEGDIGLGDTISRAIKTATKGKIKECGGCSIRRDFLNKKFPYKHNK